MTEQPIFRDTSPLSTPPAHDVEWTFRVIYDHRFFDAGEWRTITLEEIETVLARTWFAARKLVMRDGVGPDDVRVVAMGGMR